MADLIAIGYPDETTAEAAAGQARRLAHNLIIRPDAIAVIVRDERGSYHVHTSHHPVGAGRPQRATMDRVAEGWWATTPARSRGCQRPGGVTVGGFLSGVVWCEAVPG
jgi:hypothetical protein